MAFSCRALVVFVASSMLAFSARAEETTRAASLSWVRLEGAEACSDAVTLARAVDAKLGRSVFKGPSEALLLIEGRVERIEDGYRARLALRDNVGQLLGSREILSAKSDCVELSEAVALVLAVMVDPEGAMATRPVVSAPAPAPIANTEPAPSARRAPPASTPLPAAPAILPEGSVSAFARLSLGQMPRPALGFGVGFELGVSGFGGLRLEGAGFLDQSQGLAGSDAGARFRMLVGGAALCPLWIDAQRTRSTMCTGVQGGVLQARAYGFDAEARDVSEWVFSGEVALRFSWRVLGPLALHLGTALVVPIARPLFDARTSEGTRATLFEPAPVGGTFDLGLGGHF